MTTSKNIAALVVLVIMLAVAGYFLPGPSKPAPSNPSDGGAVICTMDAKQCSDGTYVGRTGPNCEFVCSVPTTPTTTPVDQKATLGINESVTVGITVIKVVGLKEDSRCATGLTCVWAGRVIVSVNVVDSTGSSLIDIQAGTVASTSALWITLDGVKPYPVAGQKISNDKYKFVFSIKNKLPFR